MGMSLSFCLYEFIFVKEKYPFTYLLHYEFLITVYYTVMMMIFTISVLIAVKKCAVGNIDY